MLDNESCLIEVLDISHNKAEAFAELDAQWIRDCECFLLFVDLSGSELPHQAVEELVNVKDVGSAEQLRVVVVGSKADLIEEANCTMIEKTKEFAKTLNAPFVLVSSKTGVGVAECVNELVRRTRSVRMRAPSSMAGGKKCTIN
jgi:predicted GTPase